MKKSLVWISVLILANLFSVPLFLIPTEVDAKDIKIGIIDTYSCPPAVYAEDALNGFNLALKEINAAGVLGKKIEFTTRDEKFKPDIALNMAKELVLRQDVDILVGAINSAAALAVSEAVSKKEKVPFIVWISKSENITGKKGHR
jgi:branched-chain amino acid transport system substrate-binding protein